MADQDSGRPGPRNVPSGAVEPGGAEAQAEQQMRKHLGLTGRGNMTVQQRPEQARQRHRFVQDGGVPVVMLNHRTDESAALRERIGALEQSLENERGAHAATRRTVSEQAAQIQSLETRLVHAELAHREAVAQEQRTRSTLQEQIAQLHVPQAPRPVKAPVLRDAAELASGPKKRGRPRLHPPKEPKPVRWWTPGFKAKTTV